MTTQTGKIEFRIITDENGNNVELEKLTIAASRSLISLLTSLTTLAESDSKDEEVLINVTEGSAIISLEASERKIAQMENDFFLVAKRGKDRKQAYVQTMNHIRNTLMREGIVFEATIKNNRKETSINDIFGNRYTKRKNKFEKPNKLNIEFLRGKLLDIGGKGQNTNFHLESVSGNKTIKCQRAQATLLNRTFPVYSEVYIAVWNLSNNLTPKYEYCDYYTNPNTFSNFKSFVRDNFSLKGTGPLKHLHKELANYYNAQDYVNARKLIRLFAHELADVSRLRSILLISKSFKENDIMKDIISEIEKLIEKKIGKKLN